MNENLSEDQKQKNKKSLLGSSKNEEPEERVFTEEGESEEYNPDNLSEEIPSDEHSPIDEGVNEKSYSNPHKDTLDEEIEEPEFIPPSLDEMSSQNESASSEESSQASPLSNPAMSELTDTEKREGAETLADVLLDGYEKLHDLAQWYSKVDEEDLLEMHLDGKIDMNMDIPADDTGDETVSLKEFVQEYNKGVDTAIVLDPDFKAKVKPRMVRVFIKRGWGLSDEQYLLYMFGRDMVEKTTLMFSMKRSMDKSLRLISKSFMKMQELNASLSSEGQEQDTTEQNKSGQGFSDAESEEVETEVVSDSNFINPKEESGEGKLSEITAVNQDEPEERE